MVVDKVGPDVNAQSEAVAVKVSHGLHLALGFGFDHHVALTCSLSVHSLRGSGAKASHQLIRCSNPSG